MPPRRSTRRTAGETSTPPPPMDAAAIEALVTERVAAALANLNAGRNNGARNNNDNSNTNNNGNVRACSYKDFSNCKPKQFFGDGGVIALTRWFEKIESIFEICSCPDEAKVKFAACTFADAALSWWNGHVKTVGLATANATTWHELKTMMLEEYCPRSEVQNLEQEFWSLTMKGSDLATYTSRFNDLAVLCPGMVTPEYKMIERYIWGLAPQIQGMVVASRPTTFLSAKLIAQQLTDQGIRQGTMSPRADTPKNGDHKRKFWNRGKEVSQQGPQKRQETVAVLAATTATAPAPLKQYAGNLPRCNKCNFHHTGACREHFCSNCQRKGHTAHSCRKTAQAQNQASNTGASRTCYGCGKTGHIKRDCPETRGPG